MENAPVIHSDLLCGECLWEWAKPLIPKAFLYLMVGKIREEVSVMLIQCLYFLNLCRYFGLWFDTNGVLSCENISFSWTQQSIFAVFTQIHLRKMPAYNLKKIAVTKLSLWKLSYLVENTAWLILWKGIFNFCLVVYLVVFCYVVFAFVLGSI